MAVSLPIVILLYDRALLAGSFRGAWRRRWGLYLALAGTWAVFLAWQACAAPRPFAGHGVKAAWHEYARSQPGVILHYLRLAFWPHPLVLDYGWKVAQTAGEILPGTIVVGGLAAATAYALVRRSPWGLLGAWFFLILAPTSSVLPLVDMAFEHRMYLPLAAVVTAAVLGGYLCLTEVARRQWLSPPSAAAWGLCLSGGMALALGTATWHRNADYHSDLGLWQDVARKTPGNPRPLEAVGECLSNRGQLREAIPYFQQALDLRPHYPEAHNNFGKCLLDCGEWQAAAGHFEQAIALRPEFAVAHSNLGMCLAQRGEWRAAFGQFEQALTLRPEYATAHYNFAKTLAESGQADAAITHYEKALEVEAANANAHINLGKVLAARGGREAAMAHYRAAAEVQPDLVEPHYNLANALAGGGQIDAAIDEYRQALAIRPGYAPAHANLGSPGGPRTIRRRHRPLPAGAGHRARPGRGPQPPRHGLVRARAGATKPSPNTAKPWKSSPTSCRHAAISMPPGPSSHEGVESIPCVTIELEDKRRISQQAPTTSRGRCAAAGGGNRRRPPLPAAGRRAARAGHRRRLLQQPGLRVRVRRRNRYHRQPADPLPLAALVSVPGALRRPHVSAQPSGGHILLRHRLCRGRCDHASLSPHEPGHSPGGRADAVGRRTPHAAAAAARGRFGRAATPLALTVALLWTLHPLQTEAVTYIVQRYESLMALFYLLAMYAAIRCGTSARPWPWAAAAVVATLLALGTKEVAVSLPIMILLYDRVLLADSFRESWRRRWGLYLGLAAAWLAFAVLLSTPPRLWAGSGPKVAWYRIRPQRSRESSCITCGWRSGRIRWSWTTAGRSPAPSARSCRACLCWACWPAPAWALWRQSAWGLLGAWFFLILAPTSSVMPLADMAFEHRMYLPLAAVVTAVVLAGYLLGAEMVRRRRLPWRRRHGLRRVPRGRHRAGPGLRHLAAEHRLPDRTVALRRHPGQGARQRPGPTATWVRPCSRPATPTRPSATSAGPWKSSPTTPASITISATCWPPADKPTRRLPNISRP